MRIAVICNRTGNVLNVIEAELTDKAPKGCTLREAPPHVDTRWRVTGGDGFTSDDPAVLAAYEEDLANKQAAQDAEPKP